MHNVNSPKPKQGTQKVAAIVLVFCVGALVLASLRHTNRAEIGLSQVLAKRTCTPDRYSGTWVAEMLSSPSPCKNKVVYATSIGGCEFDLETSAEGHVIETKEVTARGDVVELRNDRKGKRVAIMKDGKLLTLVDRCTFVKQERGVFGVDKCGDLLQSRLSELSPEADMDDVVEALPWSSRVKWGLNPSETGGVTESRSHEEILEAARKLPTRFWKTAHRHLELENSAVYLYDDNTVVTADVSPKCELTGVFLPVDGGKPHPSATMLVKENVDAFEDSNHCVKTSHCTCRDIIHGGWCTVGAHYSWFTKKGHAKCAGKCTYCAKTPVYHPYLCGCGTSCPRRCSYQSSWHQNWHVFNHVCLR